ncbi:biotin/lipoyl-containing protein, partial [Ponticaulis sp.]|uniref:biotin/lipoyl-containing protein n=1 Tax=Ponticaulis sp. TaxID=2020902 RepID=UPI000C460343
MTDIIVPTLGESVSEATVGTWLKKAGDAVSKDEVIVELETDKVSVEVAAPEDGVLSEIVAAEGETVGIGALLGKVGAGDGAAAAPAPAEEKAEAPKEEAAAPAASSGSGDTVDVEVPAMGESVSEGTLSSWLKQPGDSISKDDILVEIETDKVAVEVPSPVDGVLSEVLVAEGETVSIGTVIARVSGGEGGAAAPAAAPAASAPAPTASAPAAGPTGGGPGPPSLSP